MMILVRSATITLCFTFSALSNRIIKLITALSSAHNAMRKNFINAISSKISYRRSPWLSTKDSRTQQNLIIFYVQVSYPVNPMLPQIDIYDAPMT